MAEEASRTSYKVVGVDVGVKRIAVAGLEGNRVSLLKMMELGEDAVAGAVEAVRTLGDTIEEADVVAIENQPSLRNPRCKAVQVAIHAAVLALHPGKDVRLSSPAAKNAVISRAIGPPDGEKAKPGYAETKRRAVRAAEALVPGAIPPGGKRDDLADAILHAISKGRVK